jgi:HicB_like antitoxin of bacterial toxin-antitoxin system
VAHNWLDLRTTHVLTPMTIPPMPVLSIGNTVYTHPVAKVMISIPDKLLERLDLRAKEAGESRSGFLQRLVEREVEAGERRRQEEINRLWDEVRIEVPADKPELLDVVQLIREDRESH